MSADTRRRSISARGALVAMGLAGVVLYFEFAVDDPERVEIDVDARRRGYLFRSRRRSFLKGRADLREGRTDSGAERREGLSARRRAR